MKTCKNEAAEKNWTSDVMSCINLIKKATFTLDEIYAFESQLKLKYPNNKFIKDKIRQQLQVLRNKGVVEFVDRGNYKKVKYGICKNEPTEEKDNLEAVS